MIDSLNVMVASFEKDSASLTQETRTQRFTALQAVRRAVPRHAAGAPGRSAAEAGRGDAAAVRYQSKLRARRHPQAVGTRVFIIDVGAQVNPTSVAMDKTSTCSEKVRSRALRTHACRSRPHVLSRVRRRHQPYVSGEAGRGRLPQPAGSLEAVSWANIRSSIHLWPAPPTGILDSPRRRRQPPSAVRWPTVPATVARAVASLDRSDARRPEFLGFRAECAKSVRGDGEAVAVLITPELRRHAGAKYQQPHRGGADAHEAMLSLLAELYQDALTRPVRRGCIRTAASWLDGAVIAARRLQVEALLVVIGAGRACVFEGHAGLAPRW
ncbi:MAG: hypothetical protein U5K74_06160 [Gemmatimonadaceae bacterium]|nr:hypothetical protein [Gemmatimonadaceae bacterium]